MILSMTGYGKSERKNKNYLFSVELKSLNSRYFDIISRVDDSVLSFENEMIALIKEKCTRGKFFLKIKVKSKDSLKQNSLVLNKKRLKKYMSLVNDVQSELKTKNNIPLDYILNIPDLFYIEDPIDNSIDKTLLIQAVKLAVKELNVYRKHEGNNLKLDLLKKIKYIEKNVKEIYKLTRKSIPAELKKYKAKMDSFLKTSGDSISLDRDRIYQEISILLERKDINEELVRLDSHIKLYYTCLNSRENSGKKINFLLQEMNREINTIGAKSDSIKISHKVVDVKDSLEQLKEQVQNIL